MGIVYVATNKTNGKRYVGKTVQKLSARKLRHKIDAGKGSPLLFHRAIRKYGIDGFVWTVFFDDVLSHEADSLERETIAALGAKTPRGYNMTEGGEGYPSFKGHRHTEEAKRKVSIGNKGRKRTEEFKRRVSEVHTGRRDTPETTARRSAATRGRKMSKEARKKISEVQRGRRHSEQTKQKMSRARSGHVTTDVTRNKISAALMANGSAALKAASVKNREKRQASLRQWNKYRDWESCSL